VSSAQTVAEIQSKRRTRTMRTMDIDFFFGACGGGVPPPSAASFILVNSASDIAPDSFKFRQPFDFLGNAHRYCLSRVSATRMLNLRRCSGNRRTA
jgi:hypothetical protein